MKKWIFLFVLTIIITGMNGLCQVQEENRDEWINKYYHIKSGNLWFNSMRFAFNGITDKNSVSDTLPVYNAWDIPMEMSFHNLPEYITAQIIPATLPPRQEGKIIISYNGTKKGTYGPSFEPVKLFTNDTTYTEKRIIMTPDIKEDFSTLTEKQLADAPVIIFENESYNFDTVAVDTNVEHAFIFRNEGKSNLIIRQVKASCGCTATNPEKTLLKPGDSSKIGIVFSTAGRTGQQHKTVTVIANDPAKSVSTLTIQGYIRE